MRFSSKNGFTLVEILVVVVLLAMAGSLVFVSAGKTMAGNRNRAFAGEMLSLCKKARRMAVDDGVPTAFNISSGQRRCWVGDSKKTLEIPEEMLIEGEGISQLNEDVYTIGFYPDGSSGGGTLTLSVSGQTVYAFRIDILTGMLTRIEEDA
jgi:general secretion pathway protein H